MAEESSDELVCHEDADNDEVHAPLSTTLLEYDACGAASRSNFGSGGLQLQ